MTRPAPWRYDPLSCPSVRVHAFEARLSVPDYLARLESRRQQEAFERQADLAMQRAWNAQEDAYRDAGSWWKVARMNK